MFFIKIGRFADVVSVESYRINSILKFTNTFFTINCFITMNILSIVLIVVAL